MPAQSCEPSDKSLGYFQSSLRDGETHRLPFAETTDRFIFPYPRPSVSSAVPCFLSYFSAPHISVERFY